MADLQNKISFDTASAVANVNALSAALSKYNAVARKVAKATKGVKRAGELERLTGTLKKTRLRARQQLKTGAQHTLLLIKYSS